MSNLLINFDFEEVNSSVFRNAQIYQYKKNGGCLGVNVLVPKQFAALYFCADRLFIFKHKSIEDYRHILDYYPSRVMAKFFFLSQILYARLSVRRFLRDFFYWVLYKTPRQQKFFVGSGLERSLINKIQQDFPQLGLRYKRVNDYYDVAIMSPVPGNLGLWFKSNFEYLYKMIEDGYLLQCCSEIQPTLLNRIVLRTRNLKNKATVHNTNVDIVQPLVVALLNHGLTIQNIGLPHMPLGINHPNYSEFSHTMSISEEVKFCSTFDAVLLTAEAGLFTAFAATDLSLIQYDNEWSDVFFGIRLFDARKAADLRDLDIRSLVEQQRFDMAATEVIKFIQQRSQFAIESRLRPVLKPIEIELGML